jgi:hypothetical protein
MGKPAFRLTDMHVCSEGETGRSDYFTRRCLKLCTSTEIGALLKRVNSVKELLSVKYDNFTYKNLVPNFFCAFCTYRTQPFI